MYKEYNYGAYQKEIKQLLRKRLAIKDKIRYHHIKIDNFRSKILPDIEKQIEELLKLAKGVKL